jgi:hypothetical protein
VTGAEVFSCKNVKMKQNETDAINQHLKTLEKAFAIETELNTSVKISNSLSAKEINEIDFVYEIITNGKINRKVDGNFSLQFNDVKKLKNFVENNGEALMTLPVDLNVDIIEEKEKIPKLIKVYASAIIYDKERAKKKIELNDGEMMNIDFQPTCDEYLLLNPDYYKLDNLQQILEREGFKFKSA